LGTSLIQTSDGGFAIAGATSSFGAGEWDVYVVKLDANGNLQWTKTIGGKKEDLGTSLIQTSDGGFAIAGYTSSFGAGGDDVYVVKLDANGNLQWTKTIGGKNDDAGLSLIQTSDGGYAIAGYTNSFGGGEPDVYVVKLDANGNLQWTKTIGGENWDVGFSLIQTSDGGYAIAGATNPSAQESWMSMSSSWMPMETSNGPKPSAEKLRRAILPHSDLRWRLRHRRHYRLLRRRSGDVYVVKLDKNGDACCAVSQTSQVGSGGGTLGSPTSSIGSGGTITSPTSRTNSGGTLTSQCP
jgi:hypothetical protein